MWALISEQHICGFRSQMERFTLMEKTITLNYLLHIFTHVT